MIITDPTLKNAPLGWAACDFELGKFVTPAAMGFLCAPGDLNRFSSRYRLAKSFRRIELEAYTQETVSGYAALFHVFLTYSAFEQFMDCCGLNLNGMEPCLKNYNVSACEAALRKIERHDDFLRAVLIHLDRDSHRKQFEAFLAGSPCNILYLAAGVRHIFAHGRLTPNAGAGYTTPAQEVSKLLVMLLIRVMDGEFTRRLRANGIMA